MIRRSLLAAPAAVVLLLALAARALASDATALRVANGAGTGWVRVPHHADFAMQTFTLEAWVQRVGTGVGFTTDATGSGIVSKPREGACGSNIASWHMDYSNTGQVMFNVAHTYSSSGLYVQSPVLPDPLARHHLATTFDGVTASIYVDGVLRASAPWNNLGTVYYGTEQVLIGANNWACGYLRGFDGWIDDVRIWNVARTGAEIAANKDCRLTGTEPGLVGYWTWDAGNLVDDTGHGHDGSITGTVVSWGSLQSLGACATTGVEDGDARRASLTLALAPMPVRDRLSVEFEIARPGRVTLDVLDVAGRRLAVWEDAELAAGRHHLSRRLDGIGGARGGVRFVRLRSGGETVVRTLVAIP